MTTKQDVIDKVFAWNATSIDSTTGDRRVFIPGCLAVELLRVQLRDATVSELIMELVDHTEDAELALLMDACIADDGQGVEFHANCMRIGQIVVQAIVDDLEADIRDGVLQRRMKARGLI